MYDESTSISNYIPAPLVIRWIKPLYRMWGNPVVQRHVWHLLKFRNYEKYTKNPSLFKSENDNLLKRSIFLGILWCVIITAGWYFTPYFDYLFNRFGIETLSVISLIVFILLMTAAIIRMVISPPPNMPVGGSPVKEPIPAAIFLHNMFPPDKMDPVLTIPESDHELFAVEIFGLFAVYFVEGAAIYAAGVGYGLAWLAEIFVFKISGLLSTSLGHFPILWQILGFYAYFTVFFILGAIWRFAQACLGIGMSYTSATMAAAILCILLAAWAFLTSGFYHAFSFMKIQFTNTEPSVGIFILAFIAAAVLIFFGFYLYGLRSFSALRRRRA